MGELNSMEIEAEVFGQLFVRSPPGSSRIIPALSPRLSIRLPRLLARVNDDDKTFTIDYNGHRSRWTSGIIRLLDLHSPLERRRRLASLRSGLLGRLGVVRVDCRCRYGREFLVLYQHRFDVSSFHRRSPFNVCGHWCAKPRRSQQLGSNRTAIVLCSVSVLP